ncbi:MAG: molybdopterin-dependent oxidoreductase [Chloroflexota bacterium]
MEKDGEAVVKSACRMCHGICGLLVHLKNDRVVKATGDPDCPSSRGYICTKGRASVELLYHPDRLKYPMKRMGERGENKWERISWDEALDTIAGKLSSFKREFGPESIAGMYGTARPYTTFLRRFLLALGTPNRPGGGHICYSPRIAACKMTGGTLPVCDYYGFGGVYPKCVVVWGCNIAESGAADEMCGYQLTQTIKRGATLIVIDPRKIPIAAEADYHLQIRPGTDGALALGMLHTIIKEKLYDKDFVEKWCLGFDKLAARVADYPPEKMADITGIPADTIREVARVYATTKPACMQWGVAIDQNINSFQTIRAVHILSGITGNIDVPGGDAFWVRPAKVGNLNDQINPTVPYPTLSPETWAKKIGAEKYRVLDQVHPAEFWEAALTEKPYPVKALMIMGNNSLVARSEPEKMLRALKKIDFIFASDMFMNPTVQMADIVLPAASWLEIDDVAGLKMVWCVMARQKLATIGECRDDKQILIDLAHRLGLNKYFPWKTVREYCDWMLKDSGITFEEFKKIGILPGEMRYRKYEEKGFETPSGKFEFYFTTLEKMGYDPLPYYVEPPESPYSTPELFKKYPLIITSGARIQHFFHSEDRQIPSLRKRCPDPLVEIHPDTAKPLGIKNGDWVWIENDRGKVQQKAKVTTNILPGVVNAQHSWWFPEKDPPEYGYKESNINFLTGGMPYDPHTGSESWRSFLCKVYKA